MSQLGDLVVEYYDWKNYLVKRNTRVGRLGSGGWEMELDVTAYNSHTDHLLHLELSVDAHSWSKREERFAEKFAAGEKYIFSDVFTWLKPATRIDQIAVLVSHPKGRDYIAGAQIKSIDEFVAELRQEIERQGTVVKNAIPQQYPLLRTMQMSHNGYHRAI